MRKIYEVSNECSPGTMVNWYEVYDDSHADFEFGGAEFISGEGHVATFHTKDELEIYLKGLRSFHEVQACLEAAGARDWDTNKYKYEIIPYESNE